MRRVGKRENMVLDIDDVVGAADIAATTEVARGCRHGCVKTGIIIFLVALAVIAVIKFCFWS